MVSHFFPCFLLIRERSIISLGIKCYIFHHFFFSRSKSSSSSPFFPNQKTHLPLTPKSPRGVGGGGGGCTGASLEWTTHLYSTWTESFSWHRQQDLINSLPQFTTEIEGLTVHFVHRRSPRPDASPLLLIHGWPGSFFEFHQIIQPLAEPDTNDVPAFHVVVPSLPGFCFSSPPPRPGWHPGRDNARIFHGLMRRLGYADGGYVVQAGDWGQFAARELGSKYTAEPAGGGCRAVHLNWCPGPLPSSEDTTDREKKVEGRVKDWLENHLGYAVMMRSRVRKLFFSFKFFHHDGDFNMPRKRNSGRFYMAEKKKN